MRMCVHEYPTQELYNTQVTVLCRVCHHLPPSWEWKENSLVKSIPKSLAFLCKRAENLQQLVLELKALWFLRVILAS